MRAAELPAALPGPAGVMASGREQHFVTACPAEIATGPPVRKAPSRCRKAARRWSKSQGAASPGSAPVAQDDATPSRSRAEWSRLRAGRQPACLRQRRLLVAGRGRALPSGRPAGRCQRQPDRVGRSRNRQGGGALPAWRRRGASRSRRLRLREVGRIPVHCSGEAPDQVPARAPVIGSSPIHAQH